LPNSFSGDGSRPASLPPLPAYARLCFEDKDVYLLASRIIIGRVCNLTGPSSTGKGKSAHQLPNFLPLDAMASSGSSGTKPAPTRRGDKSTGKVVTESVSDVVWPTHARI